MAGAHYHLRHLFRTWGLFARPHVVNKGREVLLRHPTGDQERTAPSVCAVHVVRAERHVGLRRERQSTRAVPVVSPSLTHIVHAHLDVLTNAAPVLGETTCCKDRQGA